MKSNIRKRVFVFMLCMAMLLNGGSSARERNLYRTGGGSGKRSDTAKGNFTCGLFGSDFAGEHFASCGNCLSRLEKREDNPLG